MLKLSTRFPGIVNLHKLDMDIGRTDSCNKAGSKACHAKLRSDKMNERFAKLGCTLEPGRPARTDNSATLNDDIRVLNQLRSETEELKYANEKLQKEIKNGILGEISWHGREVNLIEFLTRETINLFCTHLEVFRTSQGKIERKIVASLAIDRHDKEIKLVLAAENMLRHAEAEHKVCKFGLYIGTS